jgi:hypothetical protein
VFIHFLKVIEEISKKFDSTIPEIATKYNTIVAKKEELAKNCWEKKKAAHGWAARGLEKLTVSASLPHHTSTIKRPERITMLVSQFISCIVHF